MIIYTIVVDTRVLSGGVTHVGRLIIALPDDFLIK